MGQAQIEEDMLTPRNVLSRISYAEKIMQTAEQWRDEASIKTARRTADIFGAYEKTPATAKAWNLMIALSKHVAA